MEPSVSSQQAFPFTPGIYLFSDRTGTKDIISSLSFGLKILTQSMLFLPDFSNRPTHLIWWTSLVFTAADNFSQNRSTPRQNFKYHYGIIWVSFSVLRYHFGIAKFQSSFGHFLGSIFKVSHLKPERSSRHYGILLVSLLKPWRPKATLVSLWYLFWNLNSSALVWIV